MFSVQLVAPQNKILSNKNDVRLILVYFYDSILYITAQITIKIAILVKFW